MNTQIKVKNHKQVKRDEKLAKLANRRAMHKFQDRWKIMNIKYGDRNIVTE